MKRNVLKMSNTITKEFLEANGFQNTSIDSPIPNYTNRDGDFLVTCRFGYTDGTMHEYGCIHIDCWRRDDGSGHRITKRASVHGCICTEDDLANIVRLCNIPLDIKFSPHNEPYYDNRI